MQQILCDAHHPVRRLSTQHMSDLEDLERFAKNNPFQVVETEKRWQEVQETLGISLGLYSAKLRILTLSPLEIAWCELVIRDSQVPTEDAAEFYLQLAQSYRISIFWVKYLELSHDPMAWAICQANIGSDFQTSQNVWEVGRSKVTNLEALNDFYLARLAVPHAQIEQTYEEYSSFISLALPDSYTKLMKHASGLKSQSQKRGRYFEAHELAVAESPRDPEPWIEYLADMLKFSDEISVTNILYRSIFEAKALEDPRWIKVWESLFYSEGLLMSETLQIRFLRHFPRNVEPYGVIANFQTGVSSLANVMEAVSSARLFELDYLSWKYLMVDILRVCFANLKQVEETESSWSSLKDSIVELCKIAISKCTDRQHEVLRSLVKHRIAFSTRATSLDAELMQIVKLLVNSHGEDVLAWETYFEFCQIQDHPTWLRDLTSCLLNINYVDDKKRCVEVLSMYASTFGKPALTAKIRSLSTENNDSGEDEPVPKRQRTTEIDEGKNHNREDLRIKIESVGALDEAQVRDFLRGYCEPVDIKVAGLIAVVELGSEQQVLASLIRDQKYLGGNVVSVTRFLGCTVWLTNYPANFSEDSVMKLIVQETKLLPLALRFPSQSDFKKRVFCYVDFVSDKDALDARNKLNGLQIEGRAIVAEVSNPLIRRRRDDVPVERQVYVHNMNFKRTDEESLRKAFSKFGDILDLKIPLLENARASGSVNSGYAFVSFTTALAALEAIKLGTLTIDDRRVNILRVKEKLKIKDLPFNPELSVSLFGINSSVTPERLKAVLGEVVGSISRVKLVPLQNAALVQFANITDVGKAGMVLEGTEILGSTINVSTADKLERVPTKILEEAPLAPPTLLRRRKRH